MSRHNPSPAEMATVPRGEYRIRVVGGRCPRWAKAYVELGLVNAPAPKEYTLLRRDGSVVRECSSPSDARHAAVADWKARQAAAKKGGAK